MCRLSTARFRRPRQAGTGAEQLALFPEDGFKALPGKRGC